MLLNPLLNHSWTKKEIEANDANMDRTMHTHSQIFLLFAKTPFRKTAMKSYES